MLTGQAKSEYMRAYMRARRAKQRAKAQAGGGTAQRQAKPKVDRAPDHEVAAQRAMVAELEPLKARVRELEAADNELAKAQDRELEARTAPSDTAAKRKAYSIRRRVVDDPDIPADMMAAYEAVQRRRVFLNIAENVLRKGEQGAGLKFAQPAEIDDEIVMTLKRIIKVWSDLCDDLARRRAGGP
jgi:hypothetical protein